MSRDDGTPVEPEFVELDLAPSLDHELADRAADMLDSAVETPKV